MKQGLVAVAIALAAGSAYGQVPEPDYFASLSEPMQFVHATSGGNCHTCTWISAQGTISRDTADAFDAYLERNELEDLNGIAIHLNSPGGSLLGALELGERIRAVGANTVVAETSGVRETYGVRDLFLESDNATCTSACVFVFAAGVNRYASDMISDSNVGYQKLGRLGVHQFYDPSVVNDNPAVVFDGWARSNDQLLTGLILEYLERMGVSPLLLSLGMSVRPWEEMKWLSNSEIISMNLDTSAQPSDARLVGYPNGVGIVEVEREGRNGKYRFEFFCDSAGSAILQVTVDWKTGYTADGLEEWNLLEDLKLARTSGMYRTKQKFETNEAGNLVSTSLYKGNRADLESFKTMTAFHFDGAGSSHGWQVAQDFDFFLSEPFDGFQILPRLCLQ